MFIFNQSFTANSKKTNEPFYAIKMFEKRETADKTVFFKEVQSFVSKDVFEKISRKYFKFGDIVSPKTAPALYFGGSEQLVDLELVKESPFFD